MDTYSLKFMILTFYQKKAEETSAYAALRSHPQESEELKEELMALK